MTTLLRTAFPLLLIAFFISGCDFIGDVLEFGFWTGVIVVLLVVGVVWLLVKAVKR